MAGKTRFACLCLIALTTPVFAQPKPKVVAKISAQKIAAQPGPGQFENKAMPVSIPVLRKVTVLPDGRRSSTIGTPPWTLDLVFTKEAWTYKMEMDHLHSPAVYQGEVMKDLETGKFRLHLTKGLAR